MTSIASILVTNTRRRLGDRNAARWQHDRLGAFSESGDLLAGFPPGTPLDTALASARHHDTQSLEDLQELLKLEARDGNAEAADLLSRHGVV